MRRVWLTLFFGLAIASPGFCQSAGPSSTQAIMQPPPPPPAQDQIVLGTYVIKTDGNSGEYDVAPNDPSKTMVVVEHSEWHLTFRNVNGVSCLHTDVTKWQHITTTYQKTADGSRILHTTVETQRLLQGRSPNGTLQYSPCNLTATETYPLDSTEKLYITGYTPFTTPGYHTKYRALALQAGSSLPQIAIDVTTTETGQPTRYIPLQILTASLEIQRWDKADWYTPYSGTIMVQNTYDPYVTPEEYAWLTIRGSWNLQPK
jgi:hypothetical protein